MLDPDAAGWDWLGVNLDDGSALMAFQIRAKDGGTAVGARGAARRGRPHDAITRPDQVQLRCRSAPGARRAPNATYPVATRIATGATHWQLTPLHGRPGTRFAAIDRLGLLGRRGDASRRDGQPAGRGYLELTGYVKPLKL